MNFCQKSDKHDFFFDKLTKEDLKADPDCVSAIGCKKCDFRVITTASLTKKELEWAMKVIERLEKTHLEEEPK